MGSGHRNLWSPATPATPTFNNFRCEVHLHAVDPATYQVLPVEKVLETVDSKYDELKDVYQEYGVETLIAASASSKGEEIFLVKYH